VFNGKPYHVLLIEHNLIREYHKVQIKNSRDFNIYFEIEGIPSVLLGCPREVQPSSFSADIVFPPFVTRFSGSTLLTDNKVVVSGV
jgi:hypothetical protein